MYDMDYSLSGNNLLPAKIMMSGVKLISMKYFKKKTRIIPYMFLFYKNYVE